MTWVIREDAKGVEETGRKVWWSFATTLARADTSETTDLIVTAPPLYSTTLPVTEWSRLTQMRPSARPLPLLRFEYHDFVRVQFRQHEAAIGARPCHFQVLAGHHCPRAVEDRRQLY